MLAEQKGILGICEKLTTMARTVYSGIDPGLIGRELQINIGPWSGESTVRLWSSLNKKPIPSDKQITNVLDTAKRLRRLLTEKEISSLLSGNGY